MEYIKGLLVPVRGEIRRVEVKKRTESITGNGGRIYPNAETCRGCGADLQRRRKAAETGTEHAFLYHQRGLPSGRREWG